MAGAGADLTTLKRILNNLTPEKFRTIKGHLIKLILSSITTADTLKGVILLMFEKVVAEPSFCLMYAQLCSDLSLKIVSFPSDEHGGRNITFQRSLGGRNITFQRILLNICQEAFEDADKLIEEIRQMTAPEQELPCFFFLPRILNNLTPDEFRITKDHLVRFIYSSITTPDILKGVVSLIYERAVLQPSFCPMYAQLCSDLSEKLASFPFDEPGGTKVTFKRVLLNTCQEAFEGAEKLKEEVREMTSPEQELERINKERMINLRFIGNIRLIGELLKHRIVNERIAHVIIQKLLGDDSKSCPAEENVEALCHFIVTVGEQLDKHPMSRKVNDKNFNRLEELKANPQLAPQMRCMVKDVLDLRSNSWVPEREEVNLQKS